jgi:hypothetical protein
VVRWFAADGVMTVQGVMAGDGGMLNVELSGRERIATFLNQVPAPPDFYMQVSGFARTGDEAEQTGSWSIASEQSGTFGVNWRQNADGLWQIVRWDFVGF